MSTSVSSPAKWNAADYAANSVVQQTWARELISKLKLRGDERILDVGCGDGKVTAEIARAVPKGEVMGVDASPQMIEFAKAAFPSSAIRNLEFRVMDARQINAANFSSPSRSQKEERRSQLSKSKSLTPLRREEGEETMAFDIVFSNAALHWMDDHQAFLRGASSVLRSSGRLVVSCGGKGNAHDVFVALRPEMRLKRWREFFRKLEAPYFFYSPSDYEKWLPKFGFKTRKVRLAPKDATYAGREGFAAWLRTTWLPYTQRVPEELREEFIGAVVERYLAKHPVDATGLVHVRMVRLEIDATKL
jgi:trans-aconitate methyltransferase